MTKGSGIVSVSGIGCVCAAGNTIDECMDSLFRERRKPAPPVRFTSGHTTTFPVFEVADDFESIKLQGRTEVTRTGRLALVCAYQALRDAGLNVEELMNNRTGICMGTTVGTAMNNETFYRQYVKNEQPDIKHIKRLLRSNPSTVLAREFGTSGPCQTVANACSSGTDAIGIAYSWIRSGLCDIVLAGGADELCHVTYNGFISLMITDDGPCRPFDKNRKGLNLGEGAAVLVLESEHHARNREKKARGYVVGYGASCDAFHFTAPHPEGQGLRRAIANAVEQGNTSLKNIAFVNAHGTGTPDNDRVETHVLADLLPDVPFISTKGHTGHTLGAAGAIEAAFTVTCLERGRLPKNAGFDTPDPDLPAAPASADIEISKPFGISESLAFGGHNGVLLFAKDKGLL